VHGEQRTVDSNEEGGLTTDHCVDGKMDKKEKSYTCKDRQRNKRPPASVMIYFWNEVARGNIKRYTACERKCISDGEAEARAYDVENKDAGKRGRPYQRRCD
jgi:hypothetical protein